MSPVARIDLMFALAMLVGASFADLWGNSKTLLSRICPFLIFLLVILGLWNTFLVSLNIGLTILICYLPNIVRTVFMFLLFVPTFVQIFGSLVFLFLIVPINKIFYPKKYIRRYQGSSGNTRRPSFSSHAIDHSVMRNPFHPRDSESAHA